MWLLVFGKQPEQCPPCASCGGVTRIVTTIPATRERAATHVFECTKCGVIDLRQADRQSQSGTNTLNGTLSSL